MPIAELAAELACLFGPESARIKADREALGQLPALACAADPAYPPAQLTAPRGPRWITTDSPPVQVQPWPVTEPPPPGWHEVDQVEAHRLQTAPPVPFAGVTIVESLESRVAALSTADSPVGSVADRRPPRTPREARFARVSRLPRLARTPRAPRQSRAPRSPRKARPPRPPRMKRAPRPPRPPFKKTKLDIGWCKRPACTCWTPAGCIGPELTAIYEQTGWIKANAACFPGPCWDYGACVTHQCGSDAACLVHGILQFWIKQYKAVAVWVDPVLAPIAANAPIIQRTLLRALPAISSIIAVRDVLGPPKFRDGCPEGWYWGVGLTGISCQPDGSPQTPATREQLIQFGIIPGP